MQTLPSTFHCQRSASGVTEGLGGGKPPLALLVRMLWAAVLVLPAVGASAGVVFTNLHSFAGVHDGANPYSGLVAGSDGSLYGTTSSGGTNNLGTVFKISPGGALTSLYSFNGTDGAAPYTTLVRGADGVFYGTTHAGGVGNSGTIFQFTTNNTLTTLFSFPGTNDPYQGSYPDAALVQAADGSFWGTAGYGGMTNASYRGNGYGTVFQLNTNGTVTVPVLFANTNGAYPLGGLVLGQDGDFYGAAAWGGRGIARGFPGYGTIFKLSGDGTITNLYVFTGFDDGGFIYARLVQGRDGYLYGAAFGGGAAGYGTLFKISTNGLFSPLYTFDVSDSGSPYGGMIEGSDGNFYGTTYGAYAGSGSVFRVTPDGGFTNLVLFNRTNGARPVGALVQGADGDFYGTTSEGGAYGFGTVFKVSVPFPPVIKALTLTNGTVTLTWSAVAGQAYRVQYTDDLSQTNWSYLNKPAVADSGVMTATDAQGGNPSAHRYYRVVLQ